MTAIRLIIAAPIVLGWITAAAAVAAGHWLLDEYECLAIAAQARTHDLHDAGMAGRWDPDPPTDDECAVIALAIAVVRTGVPVPYRAEFLSLCPCTWIQEPTE